MDQAKHDKKINEFLGILRSLNSFLMDQITTYQSKYPRLGTISSLLSRGIKDLPIETIFEVGSCLHMFRDQIIEGDHVRFVSMDPQSMVETATNSDCKQNGPGVEIVVVMQNMIKGDDNLCGDFMEAAQDMLCIYLELDGEGIFDHCKHEAYEDDVTAR